MTDYVHDALFNIPATPRPPLWEIEITPDGRRIIADKPTIRRTKG